MRITATRRLQFAIGHRVHGHEGKCAHLHGHNFVFFLTAQASPANVVRVEHTAATCPGRPCGSECDHVEFLRGEPLDRLGRVIDFGVLKERLGGWIERMWDHGFLLWDRDAEARRAVEQVYGQKYFVLPYNPTAENLGRYILEVVGPQVLAGTGVRLVRVVVHETENGIAEVEVEHDPN